MTPSSQTASPKPSLGLAAVERKTVLLCAGWAIAALIVFSAFWIMPSTVQASSIGMGLSVLIDLIQIGAFAIATLLCWRNAKEGAIVSGQIVWQAIAAGLAFYALGDIVTVVWHLLWGAATTAALGDVCRGISYLFLAIGLFNAVLPRQTSLSLLQTLGVSTVGVLGIVLASWISFYAPQVSSEGLSSERPASLVAIATETTNPGAASENAAAEPAASKSAPKIVRTIDERLAPIADKMGLLYVAGDCILIVMAAALLVAFWGGTYSEAWKLIAIAGLCLYVADMFMVYHQGQGSYQAGAFWEIFWVLSALFFGLGASVEHGISTRMKQKRSRQQWI